MGCFAFLGFFLLNKGMASTVDTFFNSPVHNLSTFIDVYFLVVSLKTTLV